MPPFGLSGGRLGPGQTLTSSAAQSALVFVLLCRAVMLFGIKLVGLLCMAHGNPRISQ